MDAIAHSAPDNALHRPRPSAVLTVRAAGHTDRGSVRNNNEDQFLVVSPAALRSLDPSGALVESQLLAVADGMGGHAGGELASSIAVRSVRLSLLPAVESLPEACSSEAELDARILAEMRHAVERAHESVREEAELDPELADMGTTLTVAYRHGNRLFVAHAGDSRCYLLRGGKLTQITRDHTLVNELIRGGFLQEGDEAQAAFRNVLVNALGGGSGETPRVELRRIELRSGDTVLLCTDGLNGMLSSADMAVVLNSYPDPQEAAVELVALANAAGGYDNITAVVARVEAQPGHG